MKKVLFILGNFFPEPSANSICGMEIMQQLVSEGCEVHCIANRFSGMNSHELLHGVNIHRIPVPVKYDLVKKYNKSNKPFKKLLLRIALKMSNIYHLAASALYFPFPSLWFCLAMRKKTKLLIKNHGIDTVICVNQPMASLYVGIQLKKATQQVNWIAYLLDPITNGFQHPWLSKSKADRKLRVLQEKVLSAFDLVIAQNEHKKLFLSAENTPNKAKIYYLGAPLLAEKNVAPTKLDTEKKIVIYAGGLSSTRSPEYIAKVFRYVQSAVLHIYTSNQSSWIKEIVVGSENIVLHSAIDRTELLSIMKGADALLSIGNTQSEYAPSKIIECISFGKPLIATYRTNEDTCRSYMEKYPCGLYLDERRETVEDAAARIDAMLNSTTSEVVFSKIEEIYWDNTPQAFVDVVKKTEENGGREVL